MNTTIFIKDIRLILKDLKFQVFFLIMIALFILSAISNAITYKTQMAEYQESLQSYQGYVSGGMYHLDRLLVGKPVTISNPPSPALLFSSYNSTPDIIRNGVMFFSPRFYKYGTTTAEAFQLNWNFILGTLMGLFMLIMSFEAVSHEKRAGTLRLLSVSGSKRSTVLWHKYLAYILTYSVSIILSALISLILFFTLSGTWSLVYMLKFLLILLISLPFASFFILLGMFISMAKNYRNAVVVIVFVWLFFVIIVPKSTNILAKQLSPLKTTNEYEEARLKAWNTEWDAWGEKYGKVVTGNGDLEAGLRAKSVFAADEMASMEAQKELNDSIRQAKTTRAIASISPFAQFEAISEIVFDKGFYMLHFLQETTKRLVNQITNLMKDQDSHDETSIHQFYSWAASGDGSPGMRKVTFSSQPFEHPDLLFVSEIHTDDAMIKTMKILLRLLPILALNMLLVVFCVVKLERLDIR